MLTSCVEARCPVVAGLIVAGDEFHLFTSVADVLVTTQTRVARQSVHTGAAVLTRSTQTLVYVLVTPVYKNYNIYEFRIGYLTGFIVTLA